MGTMASQITSPAIVYSTVYSHADQRKHQSSVSLAFVRGIHLGPVNSPHKWPVMRKMFPFHDLIMNTGCLIINARIFKLVKRASTCRSGRPSLSVNLISTSVYIHPALLLAWTLKCMQNNVSVTMKTHFFYEWGDSAMIFTSAELSPQQ